MDYTQYYSSPMGEMLLASDGVALVGVWFVGQRHFAAVLAQEQREQSVPVLEETRLWLDSYFRGDVPPQAPNLSLRATPFQRRVWECLLAIPYGKTATYGEIAERVARGRGAARAVGGAVGRNAISVIIPCHRVVAADGSLTGYAAGTEIKAGLLRLEAGMPLSRELRPALRTV